MNKKLPAPHVTPARRQQILREVLAADKTPSRVHRRHWVGPVIAAATVAAVSAAVVVVSGPGEPAEISPGAATDTPTESTAPESPVRSADRGPVKTEVLARTENECMTTLGLAASEFEPVYARMVETSRGAEVAAAFVSADGKGVSCLSGDDASRYAGPGSKSLDSTPSAERPVVRTGGNGGGYANDVETGDLLAYETGALFRVTNTVSRVEMRIHTETDTGVWRTMEPQDGYVYVLAWNDARIPWGTKTFVDTRAFDRDDKPITSDALGSVEITDEVFSESTLAGRG